MSVVSAAVFAKDGTLIFSRQFVDIEETKIHGILSAFPKLINLSNQHTFVEKDAIRYLYQPMDTIFIVLVTLKSSNIVTDLDTLKLLAKIIPLYCENRMVNSDTVRNSAFELIFAFDEVMHLGSREKLTVSQIEQYIGAVSHEEEVQTIIRKNKEKSTKREMMKKSMEISMNRARERSAMMMGDSMYGSEPVQTIERVHVTPPRSPKKSTPVGMGLHSGMKLKRAGDIAKPIIEVEEENEPVGTMAMEARREEVPQASVFANVLETISVILNKDGGMENMEVKGELSVQANEESSRCVSINTDIGEVKQFEVKLNPIVNKNRFLNEGVIENRDKSRPYPLKHSISVIKWRYTTNNESNAPLMVTCWPTELGNGRVEVSLEYELNEGVSELMDVVFYIPIPAGASPNVSDGYEGEYRVNAKERTLEWYIPLISKENGANSMIFEVQKANVGHFFPVSVSFVSSSTYYPIKITSVSNEGGNVSWESQHKLSVDQYTVT